MKVYLKDFCVFMSVAETASLSKTAADMGMSISSVSIRLSKLEDYLSTTLFERTTHGVKLTPLGKIAYYKTLRMTEEFSTFITDLRGENIPQCDFFINTFLKDIPFAGWLYEYNINRKDFILKISYNEIPENMPLEINDIVISNTRSTRPYSIHRKLKCVRRVIVTSVENQMDDSAFPEIADNKPVIYYSVHENDNPEIISRKENEYFYFKHTIIISDPKQVLQLVKDNNAIAVGLPHYYTQHLCDLGQLREIDTEWHLPPVPFFLIWRERRFYKQDFINIVSFLEKKFNHFSE